MLARSTAATLLVALQFISGTAHAHMVERGVPVATSSTYCVHETAQITDDGARVQRGTVRSYRTELCTNPVNRGELHLAQALWIWVSAEQTGQPRLCAKTQWYYNPDPTWAFSITVPTRALCGAGWYEVEAHGLIAIGGWKGGGVYSGRHFLNA